MADAPKPFAAPWAEADAAIARRLLPTANLSADREARVDALARRLVLAIRSASTALGGVEDMLREFSLSTRENPAMCVVNPGLTNKLGRPVLG